jgi:hypothetical protein
MVGSGTSGQETLGYFLTSTCFPFRHGRRKEGPVLRDVYRQDHGGQHQSPQIELAFANTVADDLGRDQVYTFKGGR